MIMLFAHANKIISVVHLLVDQNVLSVQIVHLIGLVFLNIVKIHVTIPAVQDLNVKL